MRDLLRGLLALAVGGLFHFRGYLTATGSVLQLRILDDARRSVRAQRASHRGRHVCHPDRVPH